ncbi:MAG: 1-deoxy-D-xylulose-5-phosphate reductoisomerase [Bacteroidales bacterium]|jgi:1-deoxy-D-xylulose-5-phosphate reductoisomerase|nr:1-deoxy-D-xylulose-5-phosphate reductoisomerase [Bacteroidales bacterium]
MKHIAILGSTGSIGTQTLEVIEEHPDNFCIEILTARNNYELLIKQALKFKPNAVVIENEAHYEKVRNALSIADVKVFAGYGALIDILNFSTIDTVVTALVGAAGLQPTLHAIKQGKRIALANKETLVVGGALVMKEARLSGVPVLPIDSEHSAIFQCLLGETAAIEKVLLTGSGGPFRGFSEAQLRNVGVEDALKHPTWRMGKKITVDSATLMNKGLEMIEAGWLFNVSPEQIEVVIHPQSIIHSLVMFEDSSVKAQMGYPSMKVPIQFALSFPLRLPNSMQRLDLAQTGLLTFEKIDTETFRCLALAREAMRQGGNMPCILNAANEIAVHKFLGNSLSFSDIAKTVEHCMRHVPFAAQPSLQDLLDTDRETRALAETLL